MAFAVLFRLPRSSLQLSIHFASMTYTDHQNHQSHFLNLVDNAVVADPQAIQILVTGQLMCPLRTGIVSE
jgi:hypothetical protein